MFLGFFALGDTVKGLYQSRDNNRSPAADGGTPTFRVYGESETAMQGGTGNLTAFDSGTVTGLYQFSFDATADNGYERGKCYTVRVQGIVSAVARTETYTFIVV